MPLWSVLKAKIVVERLNKAQLYRNSLEPLRKSEMKRLKKELSPDDYFDIKNVMWILRKKPSSQDLTEKIVLTFLFKHSPKLELAYNLCNDLTKIFLKNLCQFSAKQQLVAKKAQVKKSNLVCFDLFLSTLVSFETEILNYFDERYTNGFVEGLNNKIKVIKRRGSSILNLGHWFQRIYLDMEGYSLLT